MSTQTIDAIELVEKVNALAVDCLRRDNIPKCDLDAMLFAYSQVLDVVKKLTGIEEP